MQPPARCTIVSGELFFVIVPRDDGSRSPFRPPFRKGGSRHSTIVVLGHIFGCHAQCGRFDPFIQDGPFASKIMSQPRRVFYGLQTDRLMCGYAPNPEARM